MRTAVTGLVLCTALVLGTGWAVRTDTARPPAPPRSTPAAEPPVTFAYGPEPAQRLTVHRAAGGTDAPHPGVLLLHGGYWAHRTGWLTRPEQLAAHGFVVLDVTYSLSGEARWPAQRADVLAALDWAVRHADRIGLDPGRVAVVGSSAGGHLAAVLGAHSDRHRVRGVVALSPVASPYQAWRRAAQPDASRRQRLLGAAAERLLGCRPVRADARCRERWRDSAVHGGRVDDGSVDDGPPMLLLHSEGDFVPAAHSREVAAALPGVTVRVLPGDAHGVALLELPGVASEVLAWLDARTGDRSDSVASGPSRPQSRERAWIVPTPGQTP